MTSTLTKYYWNIRRVLLKNLIPEFIWPKEVTLDGVNIKVRNTPYSFGAKRILRNGAYEVTERKLLVDIIKSGDVIFEMGGSIGILTAIMGQMVGQNGKVFSVEASKTLTAYSTQWLEKKGNIKILTGFAFPIDRCSNEVKINSFDESLGSLGGVVSFEAQSAIKRNSGASDMIYDIKTIADTYNISPDILVVDIEGSERMILQPGASFMASIKYILIELHPHMYGEEVKQDIISGILSKGYIHQSDESNVYLFRQQSSSN